MLDVEISYLAEEGWIIETQLCKGHEVQPTPLPSSHPWLETNCFLSALSTWVTPKLMQAVESFFQTKVEVELQISDRLKQGGPGEACKDWRAWRCLQLFPRCHLPVGPSHLSWVCHGIQFELLHKYTNVGVRRGKGNVWRSSLYTSFLKPSFIETIAYIPQDENH